jgi:hypothetical protein
VSLCIFLSLCLLVSVFLSLLRISLWYSPSMMSPPFSSFVSSPLCVPLFIYPLYVFSFLFLTINPPSLPFCLPLLSLSLSSSCPLELCFLFLTLYLFLSISFPLSVIPSLSSVSLLSISPPLFSCLFFPLVLFSLCLSLFSPSFPLCLSMFSPEMTLARDSRRRIFVTS